MIFLSYDEPNADQNFAALKARFPHARRVHGVKGIANAHIAASKKAFTKFFYVVDADAIIHPDFDFSYKPQPGDEGFVHVWYAHNPAIGTAYGYGGVKLFSKEFFKDVKSQLDFTTTLTKDIKVIPQVVCTTKFNSDSERAFRGAYREAAKLLNTVRDERKPQAIRDEAEERLNRWLDPLECEFRDQIRRGAECGVEQALQRDDLLFINDHELTHSYLIERFPEVDLSTDPKPTKDHPMKPEFFFTTRIASSLYDPFVLENLPVTEMRDAISDGQLLSKMWLADQLKTIILNGDVPGGARVAVLGGWIGSLSLLFHAYELPLKVTSIDFDERANRIAEKLNYDYNGFKTLAMDMYELDYDDFDIIINTSSEHIPDIAAWREKIPDGKFVIVQNNNFTAGNGHVSCVENSDELRNVLKFSKVLYEGTRKFPMYDRYMLIGRT